MLPDIEAYDRKYLFSFYNEINTKHVAQKINRVQILKLHEQVFPI